MTSKTEKGTYDKTAMRFAELCQKVVENMVDVPAPIRLLEGDGEDERRESPIAGFTATTGREVVAAMTYFNPLTLQIASKVEDLS